MRECSFERVREGVWSALVCCDAVCCDAVWRGMVWYACSCSYDVPDDIKHTGILGKQHHSMTTQKQQQHHQQRQCSVRTASLSGSLVRSSMMFDIKDSNGDEYLPWGTDKIFWILDTNWKGLWEEQRPNEVLWVVKHGGYARWRKYFVRSSRDPFRRQGCSWHNGDNDQPTTIVLPVDILASYKQSHSTVVQQSHLQWLFDYCHCLKWRWDCHPLCLWNVTFSLFHCSQHEQWLLLVLRIGIG